MNIKQTILAFAFLIGIGCFFVTVPVYADCGGVKTSIINCDQPGGENVPVDKSGVWGILELVINIMTAGIGVLAVGGVVYGSILYTSAGGSVEQTKQARTIIFNVIVGVAMYALMYAFLNYVIPGGLF